MNETQERSSTTTKTQVTRVVIFLASLLRVTLGLLISFEQKYGNAEFYARIATVDTPSPSKDTTPIPKSPKHSETSPQNTVLRYNDAFEFIHDVVRGKIPLHAITMQQWVLGIMTAMTVNNQPELNVTVLYKGSYYDFHHRIKAISLPTSIEGTLRTEQ